MPALPVSCLGPRVPGSDFIPGFCCLGRSGHVLESPLAKAFLAVHIPASCWLPAHLGSGSEQIAIESSRREWSLRHLCSSNLRTQSCCLDIKLGLCTPPSAECVCVGTIALTSSACFRQALSPAHPSMAFLFHRVMTPMSFYCKLGRSELRLEPRILDLGLGSGKKGPFFEVI